MYNNSICKYCCYRNSWDCGDNYYPKDGCGSWTLDTNALSEKQLKDIKRALIRTLQNEENIDETSI